MADDNTNDPNTFTINQEDLNKVPKEPEPNNPLNTGNGATGQNPTIPSEIQTELNPTPQEQPHEIQSNNLRGDTIAPDVEPSAESLKTPMPEQGLNPPETPFAESPSTAPITSSTPEPTQEDLDKKLEEQLAQTPSESTELNDTSDNKKKYLIIGIAVIAILSVAFIIYKYAFTGNKTEEIEDTNPPEITNSLGGSDNEPASPPDITIDSPKQSEEKTKEPSDKMKELESIVDDLNETYSKTTNEVYEEAVLEDIPADDSFPSLSLPSDDTKKTAPTDEKSPTKDSDEKVLR